MPFNNGVPIARGPPTMEHVLALNCYIGTERISNPNIDSQDDLKLTFLFYMLKRSDLLSVSMLQNHKYPTMFSALPWQSGSRDFRSFPQVRSVSIRTTIDVGDTTERM
ncbi:hypothetical protein Tco_0848109 [Tanacetum coccineum]